MNDFDKYGTHARERMKGILAEPCGPRPMGKPERAGAWVRFALFVVGVVGLAVPLVYHFGMHR
jgi:hypothetical protein